MSLAKPNEDNRMVRQSQEQKTKYGNARVEDSKDREQRKAPIKG